MNDRASVPERLTIRIGGDLGPSYSIRLLGGALLYRVFEGEDEHQNITVNPGAQQWQAFSRALDEIGVWNWQEEYQNPGATEGVQWFLEIEWGTRKIRSSGDCNYPVADGSPDNDPDMTPTFAHFLEAVRKLIGGREFR